MDELKERKYWKSVLQNMKESVSLKEDIISKETELSKTDTKIKTMLETLYLEEDRAFSFQRFCASNEFKTVADEISRHAKYKKNVKICEIGAGHGFLAVALAMAGYRNVSILEPNDKLGTGTGYIADKAKALGVRIWNNIDSWYEADDLYDLIITKACVHHFDNACKVCAGIRFKIENDGKWLMFDEFFANSTKELYSELTNHAHVVKYGQYEWPYSASLYVELLNLAGYTLKEIIPARYKSNYIARNISGKTKFTSIVTVMTKILIRLKLTVLAFRIERLIDQWFCLHVKFRLFTRPQLLVFGLKKIDLSSFSVSDIRCATGISNSQT